MHDDHGQLVNYSLFIDKHCQEHYISTVFISTEFVSGLVCNNRLEIDTVLKLSTVLLLEYTFRIEVCLEAYNAYNMYNTVSPMPAFSSNLRTGNCRANDLEC